MEEDKDEIVLWKRSVNNIRNIVGSRGRRGSAPEGWS